MLEYAACLMARLVSVDNKSVLPDMRERDFKDQTVWSNQETVVGLVSLVSPFTALYKR